MNLEVTIGNSPFHRVCMLYSRLIHQPNHLVHISGKDAAEMKKLWNAGLADFIHRSSQSSMPQYHKKTHLTDVRIGEDTHRVAKEIVDIFSHYLRNIAIGDQWNEKGYPYFLEKVLFYTQRNATVEAILPAFPCKSTNLNKVTGVEPDMGEEIALNTIKEFVEAVKEVYAPGARVYLVSDGHVFSDCIGADDTTVDTYCEQLRKMRDLLYPPNYSSEGQLMPRPIEFFSLPDLLFPPSSDLFDDSLLTPYPDLPTLLKTVHTPMGDICRKLMTVSCGIEGTTLRKKIENSDPSVLALYCGFSHFMFQDLEMFVGLAKTSKRKRKKMAREISFEMLKRNQAYSNLVELLFPLHLRLSIHAHINSGPKFGINLLRGCRVTTCLINHTMEKNTLDNLHIPTPWHNTPVKFVWRNREDSTIQKTEWIITKRKTVDKAMESGLDLTVQWTTEGGQGGGYFLVEKLVSGIKDEA